MIGAVRRRGGAGFDAISSADGVNVRAGPAVRGAMIPAPGPSAGRASRILRPAQAPPVDHGAHPGVAIGDQGVQVGLLNHVASNPPLLRWLPFINARL